MTSEETQAPASSDTPGGARTRPSGESRRRAGGRRVAGAYRRLTRRGRLVAGALLAVVVIVVVLVLRSGGDGGEVAGPEGPAGAGAGPPIGRLVPDELPEGFRVLEVRELPSSSPFAGSTEVGLLLFGRAEGDDPFGGGDLGVFAIRSAGLPDASAFAPEAEPVKVGDVDAYPTTMETEPQTMHLLAWDGDEAGTVIVVASRSRDQDALEGLVGRVGVEGAVTPTLSDVPEGLTEVAAGDGSMVIAGTPPLAARGYEIDYLDQSNPDRRLTVSRWAADLAWEPMLAWWTGRRGEVVEVDEHEATLITLGADPAAGAFLGWRDDQTTITFLSSGLDREALLGIAGSLREVDDEEWAEIIASSSTSSGGTIPTPEPGG